MSRTLLDTRTVRANRLRAAVKQLVDESSWRQAADVVDVSVGALENFVKGGVPQEKTLGRLEAWANRAGIDHGPVAPAQRPEWRSNEEIGKQIAGIRSTLGWTQGRLGKELGASQPDISKWEAGQVRPGYETLEAIARLVGEDVRIFQIAEPKTRHVSESGAEYTPGTLMAVLEREASAAERRLANAERYARAAEIEAEAAKERAQAAKEWALYTRIAEERARDLQQRVNAADRDRETAELLLGEHVPAGRNRGKASS